MESPIVVFNHIPKTAGTTLRFILTQNYDPDETLFIDNYEHVAEMRACLKDRDRTRPLKLVYGHAAYCFAMEYKGPVQVVTFLREPFERLVSHYHYSQRVKEDANHVYSSLGLEHFARKSLMDGYQARQLVFPMTRDEIPRAFDKRGMVFRQAIQNLRSRVSFVGIVERFDESVVMLRHHLKWPRLPIYAPLMVNDKAWKDSYSPEVRDRIANLFLPIEMILYNRAIKHHERNWMAEEQRNLTDLEELHRQDRIVEELLAQRELMLTQLFEARQRKLQDGAALV